MPMADAYDALARGVVDANWNSDEALQAFKLADVIKYSVRCDPTANNTVFVVAMNKKKWNSFTPKQQKVIEEATSKLSEKHMPAWDIGRAGRRVRKTKRSPVLGVTRRGAKTLGRKSQTARRRICAKDEKIRFARRRCSQVCS